jgi:outer membrane protein OmpA-like peptidoglycan-associated protein
LIELVGEHPELLTGTPVTIDYAVKGAEMHNLIGAKTYYINFNSGSATISPNSQSTIDELLQVANINSGSRIEIHGYTDDKGDRFYNVTLSTERAQSVKNALIGRRTIPSRLSVEGHGPDDPIGDNATEAGRAKNRRVEILFYAE